MSRWRSQFAIYLALCAVIFACAPVVACACPLPSSGFGNAQTQRLACAQMGAQTQDAQTQEAPRCPHCAATASLQTARCCKHVPFPAGESNREAVASRSSAHIVAPPAKHLAATRTLEWALPVILQAPPRAIGFVARNAVSPPQHWQPPPRATFVSRAPPQNATCA